MLVRLMYASRALATVNADELHTILRQSQAYNQAHGITGVLCFCLNQSIFLQVLEGGRSAVNQLYNKIVCDRRHSSVELLAYEEIGERGFAGWAMGQVNLSRLNPGLLLKYSERAVLDPFAVSGQASMALFKELMATASVVGQP
ncbi:MAG TPA: BLUF domain-containing protein [Rubrivivax sp.]|nr:BLUF domain-containing protein [Rubrivivax sp.]